MQAHASAAPSRGDAAGIERRTLIAVCAIALPVGAVLTIVTPVMSLALDARGANPTLIGIVTAMLPVAILVVGPVVPGLLQRVGLLAATVASLLTAAVTCALMPVFDSLWAWCVLRFLAGAAVAIWLIGSESWLNLVARPERRGRMIGIYGSALAAGFAAGPVLLNLIGTEGDAPFYVAAGLLLVLLGPILWARRAMPVIVSEPMRAMLRIIGRTPLALATAFASGFGETAVFGLLPVFAGSGGLPPGTAVLALTAFAIGNVAFQIPLGRLLDRVGTRPVLIGIAALGAGGAMALTPLLGHWGLWPALFVWGGAIYGLYTVGLTRIGQRLAPREITTGNAAFAILYESGAVVGPPVAGAAMDALGPVGFPTALAVLLCGLLIASMAASPVRDEV